MAQSLEAVLGGVPFYGGYTARRGMIEDENRSVLKEAGTVMQLQEAASQIQDREALRRAAAESGGDLKKFRDALVRMGRVKDVTAIDKDLREADAAAATARYRGAQADALANPRPQQFAPPEVLRLTEAMNSLDPLDPQRQVIQQRLDVLTTRPDRAPQAPSDLGRLIQERDALPAGDPRRQLYDRRIERMNTHTPPVNVYSNSLVSGVDEEGRPVFIQPSQRDGVAPRPVAGVYPPERAGDQRERQARGQVDATLASVEARVRRMSSLINQGGSITGGVVGPQGVAGRIAETVQGVVQPNAPTPSIDYQNEMRLLLSDVRKMVENDPNLSKDERQALYETLGGGTFQTPGSALRTLNNVVEKVKNSAVTRGSRAPARRPGGPGAQFETGKVYVDANGNRAKFLGDGRWEPQ